MGRCLLKRFAGNRTNTIGDGYDTELLITGPQPARMERRVLYRMIDSAFLAEGYDVNTRLLSHSREGVLITIGSKQVSPAETGPKVL